jgi:hypothetical protein
MTAPAEKPAAAPAEKPADALGEAWELLDLLPRSAGSPSMTATTLEMAAVGAGRPVASRRRSPWIVAATWAVPAAAVVGGLVLGYLAGRVTAPVAERRPGGSIFERIEALEEQQREFRERQEARDREFRRRMEQSQRRPPLGAPKAVNGPPDAPRPPAETRAPPN